MLDKKELKRLEDIGKKGKLHKIINMTIQHFAYLKYISTKS